MDIIFAYLAGLLTLINPCVLPVLPIVLAGALQANRFGPLALAAGMGTSFVAFGMFVATIGFKIGLDETLLSQIGATMMILFGLVLLIPRLADRFTRATSGLAARADENLDQLNTASLRGQFLSGGLLGMVWSPCIGPTLGGAIALASQGENLAGAFLIMLGFALGVASLIIALGYGARSTLLARGPMMRGLATRARPIMGAVFLAVGLAILLRLHHMIEAWMLSIMPDWLLALSVSL